MPKNIFITGLAGFLGSNLAKSLIQDGHNVKGNDNLEAGSRNNVPEKAVFHETDCKDLEGMSEIMEDVDIVYHCAALAHDGFSVFAPNRINRNIYQATTSVLTASAKADVERFVLCSSMARYGENNPPFNEEMDPAPQTPYAVSKVASEKLTKVMAESHDFEYNIAVPHNIIGVGQKYNDPFRNVAAIFINRMIQGKQPIIYGDGQQKRCFSDVDDCVRPMKKLGLMSDINGEIVNIGPDIEFIDINHLAEIIADILNFDLDPIYLDERPREVKNAYCSAEKSRVLLDYNTEKSLRQSLEEMVEWIIQQGPKEFEYYIEPEIENENLPETWEERIM